VQISGLTPSTEFKIFVYLRDYAYIRQVCESLLLDVKIWAYGFDINGLEYKR
jgi:hypothetical protein